MVPFVAIATVYTVGRFVLTYDDLSKRTTANYERLFAFGTASGISVSVTIFALVLGHYFEPGVEAPLTKRLVLTNGCFDSLTVLATLSMLRHSIRKHRPIETALLVTKCVCLGGICAFLSLWLAITPITWRQVFRVFVGHSVDGGRWQFGPYFWAMHSTFLPLILVACIVGATLLGRVTILSLEMFFGRAQHEDINGLNMTSRFLAVMAGMLSVVVLAISQFKGRH